MDISKWKFLTFDERRMVILETVQVNRQSEWHSRFERFIGQDASIDFMSRFIGKIAGVVAYDRQLGQTTYLRAKSIIENMRDSQNGDGGTLFKVSNTYTADVAWLAMLLFPNPLVYMMDVRKSARSKMVREWREKFSEVATA